jgi:hypothetical protein
MWKTIPKTPLLVKILIGLVLVVTVGRKFSSNEHHSNPSTASVTGIANGGEIRTASARRSTDNRGRLLAQYQAQENQLQLRMSQCYAQMQQLIATGGAPPCEQSMGMWTAELAVAQTNVYRIQTGNYQATVEQVTGVQVTPSSSGGLVRSSDVSGSDNGVGDWDRAELHGTSLYTDANGEEHELATANYYYRNKATGDMVASETENPPDYQHDWEEMRPVSR